jgi:hypothetical protein
MLADIYEYQYQIKGDEGSIINTDRDNSTIHKKVKLKSNLRYSSLGIPT